MLAVTVERIDDLSRNVSLYLKLHLIFKEVTR
jgi:hypothetical protein